MPSDQALPPDVLLGFLRREAPIEFARLQSIAQVVDSGPEGPSRRRVPGDRSHEAWLQATFRIFGSPGGIDSAA